MSGYLNFQFNGTIVVSPGESIPFPGTKTSRPAECNVVGTGSKHLKSESSGVILRRDLGGLLGLV